MDQFWTPTMTPKCMNGHEIGSFHPSKIYESIIFMTKNYYLNKKHVPVITKFFETFIVISIDQFLKNVVCKGFLYFFEFSVIQRDVKEPIFYKPPAFNFC